MNKKKIQKTLYSLNHFFFLKIREYKKLFVESFKKNEMLEIRRHLHQKKYGLKNLYYNIRLSGIVAQIAGLDGEFGGLK